MGRGDSSKKREAAPSSMQGGSGMIFCENAKSFLEFFLHDSEEMELPEHALRGED